MQGLNEFSRLRSERLLPLIQANDRAHCEPIALESAAETARVAADTLHTLPVLSAGAGWGQARGLVVEGSEDPANRVYHISFNAL